MSSVLDVKVGFAVLTNDNCSVQGYRLGTNSDEILYDVVKHCLSQKEDLCTNRSKYSLSPFHTKAIEELCHANSQ